MSAELRSVTEDDYPSWVKNLDVTFGFDYNPDEDTLADLLDLNRAFGHWADGRYVSTVGAFSLKMTVPGAVIPCGGTTVITVAPTHRRQGLLTEMMDRHLADIREHEEPIAALWASESEIYGRFGYGGASLSTVINVSRPYPDLIIHGPAAAPVRLVDESQARKLLPPFHDRLRVTQPGMFARWEDWWDRRIFNDLPSRREGYTANRWVVVDGMEGIEGYARYRVKSNFGDDGHGAGEVLILELLADSPEGWAGLWKYVLSQDLMTTYTAMRRSPEDPIFDLLAGPRRARATVSDGLWVRVMDVPTALESRSYSADFSGTVEVVDPLGISGGVFAVELSTEGSSVKPGSGEAAITLEVRDLGAIFMGRPGLARMARAGRVAGDHDTLRQADLAFSWDPQPWCPEVF